MSLAPAEHQLLQQLGFDADVGSLLRGKIPSKIEQWRIWTDELAFQPGLSVAIADGDEAERIMLAIQAQLRHAGYKAFWSHRHSENGLKETDELIILKGIDPDAIVRLCQTGGENHGVSHRDILERLQKWRAICDFDVVGADRDWVALQFTRLPEHMGDFAVEIFEFCPDSVTQGVGLRREKDHPQEFAEARALFPTIPFTPPVRKLPTRPSRVPQAEWDRLNHLMASLQAMSTPTDMGIRLLAREILQSKYIFLWWD